MKVLIVGKNSYIGEHIKNYLQKYEMQVDEFDVEKKKIEKEDLQGYEVVVHVAAIVHRKDVQDWDIYKKVNVDLPIDVATLARESGVKQFVFMSSMAVYGVEKDLRKNCIIDVHTKHKPTTLYGKSKLQAEEDLCKLQSEEFTVSIIRPANVYGKGCKGNYIKRFCEISRLLPVLPDAYRNVKQGFLYIDNLCEMVRIIVENQMKGIFPAQDREAISSVELLEYLSKAQGLKRRTSKIFGKLFYVIKISVVTKVFGGVVYDNKYCQLADKEYQIVTFEEGIKRTLQQ